MRIISYILLTGIFFILGCAHLKQAEQYFDAGQYRDTIQLCQHAVKEDSLDVKAYALMGQAFMALQKPDSSLLAFNQASRLAPDNRFYKQQIFILYNRLGDNLFAEGKYYKAIAHYEQALEYTVTPDSVNEKIGDSYYMAGKHDKALAEFTKIINSDDSVKVADKIANIKTAEDEARKHLQTAKALIVKKQYDKAKNRLKKALEIKPDFTEAKYNLHMATGLRLYRKGAKSTLWDAIEQFGYASVLYPNLGEPHYYMAMSYNKKDKNEYSNAISEFELSIQVEPEGKYAKLSAKKIKELKARRKKMREFLSR